MEPRSARPWNVTSGSAKPLVEVAGNCDVVVVGAGIVGLGTALLLAQAGVNVIVLEARTPGAGTTGASTAKGSLLQGTRASQLHHAVGSEALLAYLTANQAGFDLLGEWVAADPRVGSRADAWTYATTPSAADEVRAESAALMGAGIPAQLATPDELPFATTAAVRLIDQLRLDPGALLSHLLDRLAALSVPVVWPARAHSVRTSGDQLVVSVGGHGPADAEVARELRADWVVLATLLPFPLRTTTFAAATPQMSYAIAGPPTTALPPSGMYLSAESPARSLRSIPDESGSDLLLVGGMGHAVGHELPSSGHVAQLRSWAEETYGLTEIRHTWAAHDYRSVDLLPHVGPAPLGPDRLLLASGFGKWGMTNGAAAALTLTGIVTSRPPTWAAALAPRLAHGASGWGHLGAVNARVGIELASGWVGDPGGAEPEDGAGVVQRRLPRPRAVSRVGGVRRACSAVCTHLGGIVRWNDVENTWDCPLHGSRFAADGSVVVGPATYPLLPEDEPQS